MTAEFPFFFTWSAQDGVEAVEITGGSGAYFTTKDGSQWLDLASLSYQASLGHGNRRMIAAIKEQVDQLCLAPPTAVFPAKVQLARQLLDLAPDGFSKVFFTLGGAEAVENAMKIARLVTGRYKFISRYRSYHGATLGALSLTGDYRRPPVEPGLVGVARVHRDSDIPATLEAEGHRSVAAVVLESVPGANGVALPVADDWRSVRDACDHHGALLVADEVLTGFGRTGKCFGFSHLGVVPDLITVAKGLTGGYAPLGAVLVHERVARRFDKEVLYAGLTHYAHPLGCAAAMEALAIYRDEALFDRAASLQPALLGALGEICAQSGSAASDARGLGLLAAVDVSLAPHGWRRLHSEVRARHLYLHLSERRQTAIFSPPLCIAEDDLVGGVQAFGEALAVAGAA